MDFSNQRQSYEKGTLRKDKVPSSPFELLDLWLNEAIEAKAPEPYAMSLATCGKDMKPSVRTVLLRETTNAGLIFYTNYLSAKGEDIAENHHAECLFFWHEMQRQIRVRGQVTKVSREKTQDYYQKRPYESQIGAWVSQPQSGEVKNRETIDQAFMDLKEKYAEGSVPTPEFWGGYELHADEIEFWQGGANRLHDRILYTQVKSDSGWTISRLLP